jgi:hypothetical protein
MPDLQECRAQTGTSVRAVALALIACLLSAFCWSSAKVGSAADEAATPPRQTSGGAAGAGGGDAVADGKFTLPRLLFVEASRSTPRDPPLPERVFAIAAPAAQVIAWARLASSAGDPAPAPTHGVGRSTPRVPTGPPALS